MNALAPASLERLSKLCALFSSDQIGERAAAAAKADAMWAIADDIEQTGLADDALSRLIDVLDRGGVLALHATCEDDMQIGRAILLRMAGGWHA
jgi:hypothetical protein